MADKGFFSNATQDVILAKVRELVKDQKPMVILLIVIAVKAIFLYADDVIAENKLPQELTDKCQALFDAILVTKDLDAALVIAVDLIPIIYELIKPKPVEPTPIPA